jgi:hypothetical protein
MDTTTHKGLPFAEAADSIVDYPALDQTRSELLDLDGLVCIDDQILAAAAASFDFNPIPADFASLRLELVLRATAAAAHAALRVNNDAVAGNYDSERLLAAGAVVSAGDFVGTLAPAGLWLGEIADSADSADHFSVHTVEIPHYRGAHMKIAHGRSFYVPTLAANQFQMNQFGGIWESVAVINRLTVLPAGGNFAIGSRATLYGVGVVGG